MGINAQIPPRVYSLGGLCFGGKIIMESDKEILIELPCSIFIRVAKEIAWQLLNTLSQSITWKQKR